MSHGEHRYRTSLAWSGSTGGGYEAYDRTHRIGLPPSAEALQLSADPAFRGTPELSNPEQLLLAAASSCQMLSFLAIAARSGIDVRSYADDAEAVMPEDDLPVRITAVTLRPRIVVAAGSNLDRVRRIVDKGHEECYIANSVTTEITIEPTIELGTPTGSAQRGGAGDAVVVGSGSNGLAAAITLAQAGRSVRVLEAADTIGGGMRTEELTLPGYLHDTCSAVHPMALASPFLRSLPLAEHGLEFAHPEVPLAHPLGGDRATALYRTVEGTAVAIGDDGDVYRSLIGPRCGR